MTDLRDRLERLSDRVTDAPDAWERLDLARRKHERRRRISAGLLAAIVAVTGTFVAVSALRTHAPSPSPRSIPGAPTVSNGKIAFARVSDGKWQIDTVNPNGTSAATIASVPGDAFHPAWSPDGQHVVFDQQSRGAMQIYSVNDGRGSTELTDGRGWNYLPSWSPDGKRIAFVSTRDGSDQIYVMNADGTHQMRLTNSPGFDLNPSWAPDGSRIAFQSNRDGNTEIYVMNADGSDLTRLTNDPEAFDGDPTWSPDGTRIAFASDRSGPGVYTMNANGTDVSQLTHDPKVGPLDPAWSPDGTSIAFTSYVDGSDKLGIFVFDLGTGSLDVLPGAVGDVCCPAWQPVVASTTSQIYSDPSGWSVQVPSGWSAQGFDLSTSPDAPIQGAMIASVGSLKVVGLPQALPQASGIDFPKDGVALTIATTVKNWGGEKIWQPPLSINDMLYGSALAGAPYIETLIFSGPDGQWYSMTLKVGPWASNDDLAAAASMVKSLTFRG